MDKTVDAVVVGGGLAGLLAALKLAHKGKDVTLVAAKAPSKDGRTTAMLMPTIEVLEKVGLWEGMEEISAPLRIMRLIDGSQRLIRAPMADFVANEAGLDAFGFNVPNADMVHLMEEHVANTTTIQRKDAKITAAQCENGVTEITLDNGDVLKTEIAVAADGRNSILREAAGIATKIWQYPQTAVVLTFAHSLPHNGISAEFHTETGPFTQVPLPQQGRQMPDGMKYRSSLVWVVKPERAPQLLVKSLADLSLMVEQGLQSSFGKVQVEDEPQAFPLSGMSTDQHAAKGVYLVGEAGHVFPPIGAQGFNLTVRDVVDLVDVLSRPGNDPCAAYNRKRKADIRLRTQGVDMLNRSLLTGFLPVQMARTAGISLINAVTPLRKFLMQQGLGAGSRGWL
ncbi:MAG: UbiH/UbiF family hydroxylase [Pseudomonadota bacterium]